MGAKLVLVLVLLLLLLLLLLLRSNCKNVCAWSLHDFARTEFAFTLGYGITLKIPKFFAFGCLVYKARCHVLLSPVR